MSLSPRRSAFDATWSRVLPFIAAGLLAASPIAAQPSDSESGAPIEATESPPTPTGSTSANDAAANTGDTEAKPKSTSPEAENGGKALTEETITATAVTVASTPTWEPSSTATKRTRHTATKQRRVRTATPRARTRLPGPSIGAARRARSGTETPTGTPTPPMAEPMGPSASNGAPRPESLYSFLAGALIALFAAALGYVAARSGEVAARRRARRGLATAMLAELRRVDGLLRKMVAHDSPTAASPPDDPIIEAALRELTLFHPETAARIAHFHSVLRSVHQEMNEYREKPMVWAGRLSELNRLIKARAALACRAVPELNEALRKEGGRQPPPLSDKSLTEGDAFNVPPTPFSSTEADDWTL